MATPTMHALHGQEVSHASTCVDRRTPAKASRKRGRIRNSSVQLSMRGLACAAAIFAATIQPSFAKEFSTVVNGRCGRYSHFEDWLDGATLADCEERCQNVLGCEEFGFKDGSPTRCSLFFPRVGEVPSCVGLTDYDLIMSLDERCGAVEVSGRDLDGSSSLVHRLDTLDPAPFQTPVLLSSCNGNEQIAVGGEVETLALCKLKCVVHSERFEAQVTDPRVELGRWCRGVTYVASTKNCMLAISPPTFNGTSVSDSTNSVCSLVNPTYIGLNRGPRDACRSAAAATSACGNAYWMDVDGGCACLYAQDSSSPSDSSIIPTTDNSKSSGRSFTLCPAAVYSIPDGVNELVLGIPLSAFAGLLVTSIGSVLFVAAVARRRQVRRLQEYAERTYIGRVPRFVKNTENQQSYDPSTSDVSSEDGSVRSFGITLTPNAVPEDEVLDDDPFAPIHSDAATIGRTSSRAYRRSILSGAKRMRESSATSITSLGAAFIQLMGLTFKDRSYRESRALQCQCKRKRAVNYDELNQVHLEHICRLRGINPNGPKDALIIKLFLFEQDSEQAVCKQCLLAFPKPKQESTRL